MDKKIELDLHENFIAERMNSYIRVDGCIFSTSLAFQLHHTSLNRRISLLINMLRRSKPSTSLKKRHSMFLDMKPRCKDGEEEISRYMYQTTNRSEDNLNNLPNVPGATPRPKVHHKSRLKRSSVMLDNALVRDYNLAVNHFETKESRKRSVVLPSPESNNSLNSQTSKVSSLFSSNSSMSIREYLYEDSAEPAKLLPESKRLFNVGEKVEAMLWDDSFYDFDIGQDYYRTSLDFD